MQPTEMQSPPDKMLRCPLCKGAGGARHPAVSAQAGGTTKKEEDERNRRSG